MGEGWHNNHHAYQASARQGFRWWEYYPTYYVLRVLSWLGVVWYLHLPPRAVIKGERRLGRLVIDNMADQEGLHRIGPHPGEDVLERY
jgi:stearoyl-CoA desaturase (delta-9 desaturase)